MEKLRIGHILRETRKHKGYTVMQIQQILRDKYGAEVSVKTIYGWEADTSHPSIEIFLALCDIYDFRNIGMFLNKDSFEGNEDLTQEDFFLLQKYHGNSYKDRRNRHMVQEMLSVPRELRSY